MDSAFSNFAKKNTPMGYKQSEFSERKNFTSNIPKQEKIRPFQRSFFYCLKLEKLKVANSVTSQTELQPFHKQNYKQKTTTNAPNFLSFQTRGKCNLTNRNTIISQEEMQTDYKQNERKREKERKKQRKNKEIKKDIKRSK